MGLATGPNAIVQPNVSQLIGKPEAVVEPKAVSAMIEAMRAGQISANDIFDRMGAKAQARDKADIEIAKAQEVQARTAQEDNLLLQAAQQARAKHDIAVSRLGPQGAQILTAYTLAGEQVPMVEDPRLPGVMTPDIKRIADEMPTLTQYIERKKRDADTESKWTLQKQEVIGPHGESIVEQVHYNPVTGQTLKEEDWQKRQPPMTQSFRDFVASMKPGTSTAPAAGAAPLVQPAAPAGPAQPTIAPKSPEQQLTQIISGYGLTPASAQGYFDMLKSGVPLADIQRALQASPPTREVPQVQPQAAPVGAGLVQPKPAALPRPSELPPGVLSMQAPKANVRETPKIPSEGIKDLTLAAQAADVAAGLAQAYDELVKSEPSLVGYLDGRLATWTKSRQWNEKVAKFESRATQLLAPVAKGTFNETGVLSDKDIERYKGIIPDLRDNPAVGNQKMKDLLSLTSQSMGRKLEFWKRGNYDVSGFADIAAPLTQTLQQLPGAKPAAGGPDRSQLPLTSVGGRRGRLDPNTGMFYPE